MSENMMNTNCPVTTADIAAALHISRKTVLTYLGDNTATHGRKSPMIQRVRDYAASVGYDPKKAYEYNRTHRAEMQKLAKERKVVTYYCNGNFQTREEEIRRMQELRDEGFSNEEIAKKVGRSSSMVYYALGKQDPELSRQNQQMASRIRAQKNAVRKQYILNKSIREYNAKVEEHNALKAKVAQMEAELKPQTPVVEKVAQIKIDFPLIDLHTVQPTALQ